MLTQAGPRPGNSRRVPAPGARRYWRRRSAPAWGAHSPRACSSRQAARGASAPGGTVRGGRAVAARGAGSSEHLERLHEIFRGLHGDLRGVPERLRSSAAGEAAEGGETGTGGGGWPSHAAGARARVGLPREQGSAALLTRPTWSLLPAPRSLRPGVRVGVVRVLLVGQTCLCSRGEWQSPSETPRVRGDLQLQGFRTSLLVAPGWRGRVAVPGPASPCVVFSCCRVLVALQVCGFAALEEQLLWAGKFQSPEPSAAVLGSPHHL